MLVRVLRAPARGAPGDDQSGANPSPRPTPKKFPNTRTITLRYAVPTPPPSHTHTHPPKPIKVRAEALIKRNLDAALQDLPKPYMFEPTAGARVWVCSVCVRVCVCVCCCGCVCVVCVEWGGRASDVCAAAAAQRSGGVVLLLFLIEDASPTRPLQQQHTAAFPPLFGTD